MRYAESFDKFVDMMCEAKMIRDNCVSAKRILYEYHRNCLEGREYTQEELKGILKLLRDALG